MIFYDLKLKRIDGRVHCWNVQIMVLLDKGKSRYCAYILMEANVNDGWPHISFAGLVWLGITDVSPRHGRKSIFESSQNYAEVVMTTTRWFLHVFTICQNKPIRAQS